MLIQHRPIERDTRYLQPFAANHSWGARTSAGTGSHAGLRAFALMDFTAPADAGLIAIAYKETPITRGKAWETGKF